MVEGRVLTRQHIEDKVIEDLNGGMPHSNLNLKPGSPEFGCSNTCLPKPVPNPKLYFSKSSTEKLFRTLVAQSRDDSYKCQTYLSTFNARFFLCKNRK